MSQMLSEAFFRLKTKKHQHVKCELLESTRHFVVCFRDLFLQLICTEILFTIFRGEWLGRFKGINQINKMKIIQLLFFSNCLHWKTLYKSYSAGHVKMDQTKFWDGLGANSYLVCPFILSKKEGCQIFCWCELLWQKVYSLHARWGDSKFTEYIGNLSCPRWQ